MIKSRGTVPGRNTDGQGGQRNSFSVTATRSSDQLGFPGWLGYVGDMGYTTQFYRDYNKSPLKINNFEPQNEGFGSAFSFSKWVIFRFKPPLVFRGVLALIYCEVKFRYGMLERL